MSKRHQCVASGRKTRSGQARKGRRRMRAELSDRARKYWKRR